MCKYFAYIRAPAGQSLAESDARRMKQPWFNLLVTSLALWVGGLGCESRFIEGVIGTWFEC